ncbi:MAG: glycosyltransferase family 4 protein [Bacteroidota bacterium]
MKNLVFLNSHPIQYFAPLYKELKQKVNIPSEVIFCSRHGLQGEKDAEFGVQVKWDIPILEGYDHMFLKNQSFRPNVESFFGLVNFGLVWQLIRRPKSILVVHGWGYFTYVLLLLLGKMLGHTVCLRGESPLNQELLRPASSLKKRTFFFKKILFPLIDYFLYIGQQNKAFYKYYGVREEQLVFCPYSVENNRFRNAFEKLHPKKDELKNKHGVPANKRVFLFSGKYIDKKRPLDLLNAFCKSEKNKDAFLIFMGEGEQRAAMEKIISEKNMDNVLLTGFVNQSSVSEFYTIADVFVMCSKEGETWGLSTNEAMNFNLPLILSDLTGSSSDLVEEGKNGTVFKMGDVEVLSEKINQFISLPESALEKMGAHSGQLIKKYSYAEVAHGLNQVISRFSPPKKMAQPPLAKQL